MSQNSRILAVLQDGRDHTMQQIHQQVGFCRLNSRVSELRKRGHNIECRREHGLYIYRLVSSLEEPSSIPHNSNTHAPSGAHGVRGGEGSSSETADDGNSLVPSSGAVPLALFDDVAA